ncbi:MAG: TolC family outer membrane protein [Venatoribacter sp.]
MDRTLFSPKIIAAALLSTAASFSLAQENNLTQYDSPALRDAVHEAIELNPEVQEKWHSFMASTRSYQASKSGYRPKVDFGIGYDFRNQDYSSNRNYNGAYGELTLKQMLYDGMLTPSEVSKFNHLQLVSYFNLLETTEKVAQDAFAAYMDVLRERELVALARNNLTKHHTVFKQVEKSTQAGVTRSADLEQMNGRLALAQTNLITETANLHDVSARYLRVVGHLPEARLDYFEYTNPPIPATVQDTLFAAYQTSPIYHAALRNILASESAHKSERSNYQPRVNLNARYGSQTYDGLGYVNGQSELSAGVELRYNLYNGGRDRQNIRRALQEINVAKDQRDQACINVRQTVQIAFNDTRKLAEQLPILEQHRDASEKVTTAYKQQFDIGQRTLLDVLDVENEFFQASRALVNARYDLSIAHARTLAAMGRLNQSLDINRTNLPTLGDLGAEPIHVDEASACPLIDINEGKSDLLDTDMDGVPDVNDQCPDTPMTDKVDENGCSIFTVQEVTKVLKVNFAQNSASIEKKYFADFEELAKFLRRYPNTVVEVRGYASLPGSVAYNLGLSQRRAESAANVLTKQFGINPERVTAKGLGITALLTVAEGEDSDAANRRIEAKVTASAITKAQRED